MLREGLRVTGNPLPAPFFSASTPFLVSSSPLPRSSLNDPENARPDLSPRPVPTMDCGAPPWKGATRRTSAEAGTSRPICDRWGSRWRPHLHAVESAVGRDPGGRPGVQRLLRHEQAVAAPESRAAERAHGVAARRLLSSARSNVTTRRPRDEIRRGSQSLGDEQSESSHHGLGRGARLFDGFRPDLELEQARAVRARSDPRQVLHRQIRRRPG
jgi:hypothetical protein